MTEKMKFSLLGIGFPVLVIGCVGPQVRYQAKEACANSEQRTLELSIMEHNRNRLRKKGSPDTLVLDNQMANLRPVTHRAQNECLKMRNKQ